MLLRLLLRRDSKSGRTALREGPRRGTLIEWLLLLLLLLGHLVPLGPLGGGLSLMRGTLEGPR